MHGKKSKQHKCRQGIEEIKNTKDLKVGDT
jgi:hypothetical protein